MVIVARWNSGWVTRSFSNSDRQYTLARRANEKLAARFYGPYEVDERVGQVAYRLSLPVEPASTPYFMCLSLRKLWVSALFQFRFLHSSQLKE